MYNFSLSEAYNMDQICSDVYSCICIYCCQRRSMPVSVAHFVALKHILCPLTISANIGVFFKGYMGVNNMI